MLVGVFLAQLLKATSGKKTVWLGSYRVMVTKKLHRLVKPTHSGVSAPAERLRDANEEARGQRLANTEAKGLKVGDQRDQIRSPNQEVLGHEGKT